MSIKKNTQQQANDLHQIQTDINKKPPFLAQMNHGYIDDELFFKAQITEKFKVNLSDDYRMYVKEFKIKNSYCEASLCAVYVLHSAQQERLYIEFLKF